jgi:hypothetical protein
MNRQLLQRLFMGMKRISMERRAFDDWDAMAEGLRRRLLGSLCWHTNQRPVDVWSLIKAGYDRYMSEAIWQPFKPACRSPYECRHRKVMIQTNGLGAGSSESPHSHDRKT